jgi:hypothetical protein
VNALCECCYVITDLLHGRKANFVATDTLATSPEGEPAMFTSKAFIVPHLHLIICCTGIQGFLGKWFLQVNDRMVVHGIDNLNFHTSQLLSSIFEEYRDKYNIPAGITSTVYHFGFSEVNGLVHNYVYRSANNFVSENLPYGVGVKPECKSRENIQLPIDLKPIMNEQRAIQESRPSNERVYIGGKIQAYHMTETDINVYTWDQFDDFEETERAIYDNYDAQE